MASAYFTHASYNASLVKFAFRTGLSSGKPLFFSLMELRASKSFRLKRTTDFPGNSDFRGASSTTDTELCTGIS